MLPSTLTKYILSTLSFEDQEEILLAALEKMNSTSPVKAQVFFTEEEGFASATLFVPESPRDFYNNEAIAYVCGVIDHLEGDTKETTKEALACTQN